MICPVQTLESLETTIEYRVLGNGEPPQNHWRSHPGLTFPSFHLAKSHWPSHVLRRSLGSPPRSYRFRWKRWRRAVWRYRGNLPVVIRIYHPINITTATPPIQRTQVTPQKMNSSITQPGFLQSNDEQFTMVAITIFQDRKSSAKKIPNCATFQPWTLTCSTSGLMFFQKIAAQVEAQNIISQCMSLDTRWCPIVS